MKGIIKAIRLVLPIFLILSINAFADEGWWTYLRIAGGSLYSQIEHPDIALEKEVLIYKGLEGKQQGKCEVHFLFKNTAEKPISVEVGFPVKIIIPLKELHYGNPGWAALAKITGDKNFERPS